jgi:hypothetical protein
MTAPAFITPAARLIVLALNVPMAVDTLPSAAAFASRHEPADGAAAQPLGGVPSTTVAAVPVVPVWAVPDITVVAPVTAMLSVVVVTPVSVNGNVDVPTTAPTVVFVTDTDGGAPSTNVQVIAVPAFIVAAGSVWVFVDVVPKAPGPLPSTTPFASTQVIDSGVVDQPVGTGVSLTVVAVPAVPVWVTAEGTVASPVTAMLSPVLLANPV